MVNKGDKLAVVKEIDLDEIDSDEFAVKVQLRLFAVEVLEVVTVVVVELDLELCP